MYHSNDPNNFRNKKYLDKCKENGRNVTNSFHKFISYKRKLENELTMN